MTPKKAVGAKTRVVQLEAALIPALHGPLALIYREAQG